MKSKNFILGTLLVLIVSIFFLTSCGKTDVKEHLKHTEVETEQSTSTDSNISTEIVNPKPENIYKEWNCLVFRLCYS